MRRRDFITIIASATAAWPVAVRAQQTMPVIGFINAASAQNYTRQLAAFHKGLAAGPCGDLTFIAGERRQPLTKESFGNLFRAACRKAGVPGSAHGVRKIAATRAANSGATVAQLEAIFGWSGGQMASLYTRSADRKRLALEGMHMLANEKRKPIPSPSDEVRALEQKPK
jgi:hypothetical protein